MKSGFDVGEFEQQFGKVFEDYEQLNQRALPELLKKRAVQLAVGSGKGGRYGGLFQECKALRPQVQALIKTLPQILHHHIKRTGGVARTEAQEIKARLSQAALFQASGWLVPELLGSQLPSGPGSWIRTQRGKVEMNLSGNNPSIKLTNTSPRALEFALATGYMARAVYNQTQDMLVYIQNHLDLTAKEMSKRYPNFRQPIESFLPPEED